MSITLKDLLSLPVMEGAIVRAGTLSLSNTVSGIGIVDQFDIQFNYDELFHTSKYLLGEILLSSYFLTFPLQVKLDCLHFLSRVGASGILVMNIGMFKEDFEPEVIQTAEALDFPLIQMPSHRHSCSELITPIMEQILEDRKNQNYWTNIVLEYMASLSAQERSLTLLVDIISQYTHFSIGLYDKNLNLLHGADWAGEDFKPLHDANFTISHGEKLSTRTSYQSAFVSKTGNRYYFTRSPIFFSDPVLRYLTVISKQGAVNQIQFEQVMESIRLYLCIWEKNRSDKTALCHALIHNEPIKIQSLAKRLSVDIKKIHAVLIFSMTNRAKKEPDLLRTKLEKHYYSQGFTPISEVNGDCIVLFLEFPDYEINRYDFFMESEKAFSSYEEIERMMIHADYYNPGIYKDLFEEYVAYNAYLHRILPSKKVFNLGELHFCSECAAIASDKKASDHVLTILHPILHAASGADTLLETLETFIIDANGNIDKSAEMLYVHKGTVKYRLKRINEILGFDMRKMPESLTIYKALALYRILK